MIGFFVLKTLPPSSQGLTKPLFPHILYNRVWIPPSSIPEKQGFNSLILKWNRKMAWNGKKQSIIRPQRGSVTG